MSCWQENLLFFKKNAPGIYAKMLDENIKENNFDIVYDEKSRLFRINNGDVHVWIGSTINKEREANELLKNFDRNASVVLILGIANFRLINATKKYFKKIKRLIIIEPDVKIFNFVMGKMPVKKVFTAFPKTDISIILNEDLDTVNFFYQAFDTQYTGETSAVVISVGYAQLFPAHKRALEKFFNIGKKQKISADITNNYFRYIWRLNEWRNVFKDNPSAGLLNNLFKTLPVILVMAGPSLNKNIHLLKEVGDKAIIIGVGSGIKILHNHGIIPHFRIMIEGSSYQERLFEGIDNSVCPLLSTSTANFNILNLYNNRNFQFDLVNGNRLGKYFCDNMNRYIEISSGPSVANVGVFLALYLGCKKIILMGQDLCYTENKNYAEGSWTTKKENEGMVRNALTIDTVDIFGNRVKTISTYLNVKDTLEMAASWVKGIDFVNATEGGLNIKGFANKPFSQVLYSELLPSEIDLRKTINDILEGYYNNKPTTNDIVLSKVALYKNELTNFIQILLDFSEFVDKNCLKGNLLKVEKRYTDIREMPVYLNDCSGYFSLEENKILSSLKSANAEDVKTTLHDFVDSVVRYLKTSCIMSDEIIENEYKINIRYQQ